jgi:KUP system potassium uptake protein
MTTWKTGRGVMASTLRSQEFPVERFIASITENPQHRVSGTAVYMFREPGAIPPALLMNLRHYDVLHETVYLVSVQVSKRPRVPAARRATVHDLGEGFFQVVLLFGFMDEPDVPTALKNIVHSTFGFDPSDATYFVGRESILVTELVSMAKWREHLFAFLHRNAASAARFFDLPPERVVEVGVQVPI